MTQQQPLEKSIQYCKSQIQSLFFHLKKNHDDTLPTSVAKNPYILGYMKGMMGVLTNQHGLPEGIHRGNAILTVFSTVLGTEKREIGNTLLALQEDESNLDYLEGLNDGMDRLIAPSDSRREEVTYRLWYQLDKHT